MEPFKFKEIVKALGVKFGEILKTQTYAGVVKKRFITLH